MTCSVCREEFENGQRVTANVRKTFIFKPATVPDAPGVNPAKLSTDELFAVRSEHTKTEIGKIFSTWGTDELPKDAFGVRHMWCDPQIVGGGNSSMHPVTKHSIRFRRSMQKRGAH